MNTWTILKVCCSIPSLLCFAVFVEKPTSCLSQLPVHCSKLSPIGAFSLLCCVYYVDTEFNLLFLDCSSPQWKWRRDPRQQTIYWVFWSGWWSWRGVLSHVKVVEWGQKKKKRRVAQKVWSRFYTCFDIVLFIRNAAAVRNAEFTEHVLPLLLVAFAAMQT